MLTCGETERLLPGDRIDDLQRAGLKIIQNGHSWRFGMDSVLLADFAQPSPRERVIDFGCGDGALLLLMWGRENTLTGDGIEIRADAALRAKKSFALNGLEERLHVIPGDWTELSLLREKQYTLAVANPPYEEAAQPGMRQAEAKARLRGGWETLFASAAFALKPGGRFALVYPARETDRVLCRMGAAGFALKRTRAVYTRPGKDAKLCLSEGVLGARTGGVRMLPPLEIWTDDGKRELARIYGTDSFPERTEETGLRWSRKNPAWEWISRGCSDAVNAETGLCRARDIS